MTKKIVIGGYGEILIEYQLPTTITGGGVRVSGRGGSVLLSRVALQAIVAAAGWLEVEPSAEMRNAIGDKVAAQLEMMDV